MKEKKYTWFVGIDVAKDTLDFSVMKGSMHLCHRTISNDVKSIKLLLAELRVDHKFSVTKSVFCIEKIGLYSNYLLASLHRLKAFVVVKGALHIKRTMGLVRGKSDKIDSKRIAEYAFFHQDSHVPWQPRRQIINQMASLYNMRSRILKAIKMIGMPLKVEGAFIKKSTSAANKKLCERTLAALKLDLTGVDKDLLELVKNDPLLSRLYQIIISVDGLGPQTAFYMLICTNEFKDITSPKQLACFAGIAPFPTESGTIKSKDRVSRIGNSKIKSLLHICAVSAMRSKKGFKDYYEKKKLLEGKPALVVINAIRNKILQRLYACIKKDRLYTAQPPSSPNYAVNLEINLDALEQIV